MTFIIIMIYDDFWVSVWVCITSTIVSTDLVKNLKMVVNQPISYVFN